MALTTIFTPPSDCHDLLAETATCDRDYDFCSIYLADTCYPPGAATYTTGLGVSNIEYVNEYVYSPGVLPHGYTRVAGLIDEVDVDSVTGCLRYVAVAMSP